MVVSAPATARGRRQRGTQMHATMPREKLAQQGVNALNDAELLAILLGTGAGRQPVVELAGQLLERFSGLRGLLQASRETLERQRGLGPAKSAKLLAVLELSRRYLHQVLVRGEACKRSCVIIRTRCSPAFSWIRVTGSLPSKNCSTAP
jgi:DNA repair protein RadC